MLRIEQSIERGKGNIMGTRKMLYARKMLKKDDCSNNIISRRWIGL